jgi:SprT protein
MLTKEKEKQTEQKVIETVKKLNDIYKFGMPIPAIHFDVTGTNAGLAKRLSMSVHFNTKLALSNWDDFIDNTVPHEVCHIAVWYWADYFRKPIPSAHGAAWKLMMWEVGAKAKRTHDYDVSEVKKKTKTYLYQCGCPERIEVSSAIHNKIGKGNLYRCKKCHQTLTNGELKITMGFSRASPNGTTKTREEL